MPRPHFLLRQKNKWPRQRRASVWRTFTFALLLLVVPLSTSWVTLAQTQGRHARDEVPEVPAGFTDASVTTVDGTPTGLAVLSDGRLLIGIKEGQVFVYQNGQKSLTLDLRDHGLCTQHERGLQSVVADPDFASNGYIYMYYAHGPDGNCDEGDSSLVRNRAVRYSLNLSNILTSPFVVLDNIPAPCGIHNGGDMHFGPQDGLLYISVGDGGLCQGNERARYLSTLAGKMLRINKDGSIPTSNPYANDLNAVVCGSLLSQPFNNAAKCKEIIATGLRNPFRFAMKYGSNNEFYINDVGEETWEEIDEGAIEADYGWDVREGKCLDGEQLPCTPPAPASDLTDPIFAYAHDEGCAITGGAFVAYSAWPSAYNGYYFGDYCRSSLFRLMPSAPGHEATAEVFLGRSDDAVIDLMFDPTTSALYYSLDSGEVRKVTYTASSNRAPTASATASPSSGLAPFNVVFDASASGDPDASDTLTYGWDFGDGTPRATTMKTTHTYTRTGVFTATLMVTDSLGLVAAPWQDIIYTNNTPPLAHITSPSTPAQFSVGQVITLTGNGTDAQDGALAGSNLSWRVLLHHISDLSPQNAHTHPYASGTGTTLNLIYPAPENMDAAAGSYLEVSLTATDAQGLTATVTQTLQPLRVPITVSVVNTLAPTQGLKAYINGKEVVEHGNFIAWQNGPLALSAPGFQQDVSASWFRFGTWSDGGTAVHIVAAPASGATYIADYGPSETPKQLWLPLVAR